MTSNRPIAEDVARRWDAAHADPSDLVDEMVLRLLERDGAALRDASPGAPLSAWIRRFLTNLASELWRAEVRAHRRPEHTEQALARRRTAAAQARRERLRGLTASVDDLTEAQRYAFDRYLDGWRLTDIAREREASVASTRDVLRRAVHRLQTHPASRGEARPPPTAPAGVVDFLSPADRKLHAV